MTTPPELFDPDLLALRRARAAAAAGRLPAGRRGRRRSQKGSTEVNRTFLAPVGDRAARRASGPGSSPRVVCRAPRALSDAPILDLAPGAQDLVVHALALHWANDPVGQLVQCRRALRPDGLFLGALFGGETLRELRAALAEAEVAETGGLSPRVAPMGEIRDLGGLLQRAGFALPVADVRRFDVSYADALALMRDLRGDGRDQRAARPAAPPDAPRRCSRGPPRSTPSASGRRTGGCARPSTWSFLTGWAPDAGPAAAAAARVGADAARRRARGRRAERRREGRPVRLKAGDAAAIDPAGRGTT